MMRYKLGFALPPLDDNGGVSRVLCDLREAFCHNGHEIHFFSFCSTCIVPDETIHVINGKSTLEQKHQFAELYFKERDKKGFDAFFANTLMTHRVCVEVGVDNLFMIFHQGAFFEYSSFFELVKKIIYSKLIYDRQNIVGVSKGVTDELIRRFKIRPKSICCIYNAVDKKRIIRRSLEKNKHMPRGNFILHAGRFHKIKRHDRLLRAFTKIEQNIKLVLLGSGEEDASIRRLISELKIEDRVTLLGWKDNPYPYIKSAKLVVLTSDHEALAIVLVEALLLGTPVVSTDCLCGPSEIMRGELKQFLVPVDDESMLVDAIERALISYPLIDGKYLEKFDPEFICEQYLELLEHAKNFDLYSHGIIKAIERIPSCLVGYLLRLRSK